MGAEETHSFSQTKLGIDPAPLGLFALTHGILQRPRVRLIYLNKLGGMLLAVTGKGGAQLALPLPTGSQVLFLKDQPFLKLLKLTLKASLLLHDSKSHRLHLGFKPEQRYKVMVTIGPSCLAGHNRDRF